MLLISTDKIDREKYLKEIFSKGHRNPQGLAQVDGILFSTEHGPQGGDEINIIEKNKLWMANCILRNKIWRKIV